MRKSNYGETNLDLRVIWPKDFFFRILVHIRSPVDHKHTPPTLDGRNEKTNYEDTILDIRVILPADFKYRILDRVRQLVDHDLIPPTQNGHNGKIGLWAD